MIGEAEKIKEKESDKTTNDLRDKLGQYQRKVRERNIPVVVVFEGWDSSRVAFLINQFIHPLDPRGFTYHSIGSPDENETSRPFFWRFWVKTPTSDRIAIFDRSWYSRTIIERTNGSKSAIKAKDVFEINEFERNLTNSGTVIVKIFLDTGKEAKPKKSDQFHCELLKDDREMIDHQEKYVPAFRELIRNTNNANAPWTMVRADGKGSATTQISNAFISRLDGVFTGKRIEDLTIQPIVTELPLENVDRTKIELNKSVDREDYKKKLEKYQKEMKVAQCRLMKKKKRLIVVFEGRDASGKGGSISRITSVLNPRTYQVNGITAPNDVEKAHHYMWRFYNSVPPVGHITIFDRSWYGRVLVERVEKFTPEKDWRRGYHEINMFEKMLSENDSVVVKLWMEIDKKTQLARFNDRESCPLKLWKITSDDWTARERWEQYSTAIDEMLQRTSTTYAPWTIVEANNKEYARLRSMRTILDTVNDNLDRG